MIRRLRVDSDCDTCMFEDECPGKDVCKFVIRHTEDDLPAHEDDISEIMGRLVKFRDDRDFEKLHRPYALARAVMIEAGELNELFLRGRVPSRQEIAEEVADVMIFCLNLCEAEGIDPLKAISDKITANEIKYSAEVRK